MPTMPSFHGLAKGIIESLGSEKAAEPFNLGQFDRTFNALYREFDRAIIDGQLYKALRTPKNAQVENHKNLLKLSRSVEGKPQLVTTNFDLLFEKAERGIRVTEPPIFPSLDLNQPIDGLVYLHGRLTSPRSKRQPSYIVSSSDFGRAYLSQGWATNFVKLLREQYTIVLIGYQAEDPPMRYLLEGLHTAEDDRYSSPIYAFTPGNAEDAVELWDERGVTPIAYSNNDMSHKWLWKTVDAWAASVSDPDKWTKEIVSLSQKNPQTLQPYQRGQIAQMVSSKGGAKAFADADPAPPAQWLCVFDSLCRYAEPSNDVWAQSPDVDPLDLFGLDDDPPRPISDGSPTADNPGRDYLAWNGKDESFDDRIHFSRWSPMSSNQLPSRMHHLARWFQSVMDQPAAIWWAADRQFLNPNVVWFIRREVRSRDLKLSGQARFFWNIFLERSIHFEHEDDDIRWHSLKEAVGVDGWNPRTLQLLERISQPHINFKRRNLKPPHPPNESWNEIGLQEFIELNVKILDRRGTRLDISDKVLADVVEILRRSLEKASYLMSEIGRRWWGSPTLHPTGDAGEHFQGTQIQYYLWFKSLFDRLLEFDPIVAKKEINQWNPNDSTFFGKLVLYYSSDVRLFSTTSAFKIFEESTDDVFWSQENQRELLFSLRDLWPRWSVKRRAVIETRIANGPDRWKNEKDQDYRLRKASSAASRLRWLELKECQLTKASIKKLQKLKLVDERWSDQWAMAADDSLGSRGGLVKRVTQPQGLQILAVNEIVSAAENRTKDNLRELQDYRPFVGLVKEAPFRALAALRVSLKKDEFPERFWENILYEWPEKTSIRLRWFLAETIARLSSQNAVRLKHAAPDWLKNNIKELAKDDRDKAMNILDKFIEPFASADPEDLQSAIGTTTVSGVRQDRSEYSISKAINSPAGKLTQCLWELLPHPRKDRKLPKNLVERFNTLFSLPGLGGGHAVAIVTQHLGWLDYWFNDWVCEVILPLFDMQNPLAEGAWHGLAYDRNGLSRDTLELLNASYLELLRGKSDWLLDEYESRQHIHRLVALSQPDIKKGAIVTFTDVNSVLKAIDDLGRSEAVTALSNILERKNNWYNFVKPFLLNAWPRQIQFKGERASRAFGSLISSTKENFVEAVEIIAPLVQPVSHLDMFSYYMSRSDDGDFEYAREFPESTLKILSVLIDENRRTTPFELAKVLNIVVEAKPALKRSVLWRRLYDLTL